ncbi:MAG: aldo/keto reductase [Bacteroidia bacterium]
MNSNKLIYGCMGLGDWNQRPLTSEATTKGFKALETAIDCGINTFDHANIYTFGKAEEIFGKFLKNNPGIRNGLKINSKAGIILNGGLNGSNTYSPYKQYLLNEINQSLTRLNVDYLDTFILHRYDPLTSAKTIAETLDFIVDNGLAKQYGLSNVPPKIVSKIASYAKHKPVSCQIQFSLGHSDLIKHNTFFNHRKGDIYFDTLEDYESLGVEIEAWGPLDKGLFLGDFSSNPYVQNTKLLVAEMAKRYGVSAESILLGWINKLPFNIKPIIGTSTPDRIRNCTEPVELSREDWYNLWISSLHEPLP